MNFLPPENIRLTTVTLLLAILLSAATALAHRVMVFAWVEAQTVHTESKFSGGKLVKGGRIEVFDQAHKKVTQGLTDDRGRFDFSIPQGARQLDIVLTTRMGHTGRWTVSAQELGATVALPDPQKPDAAVKASTYGTPGLNAEAIEAIVERSLEKKLAPLRAQIAAQSWGLRDIVAGLGYILGLMGLASYLRYRRTN